MCRNRLVSNLIGLWPESRNGPTLLNMAQCLKSEKPEIQQKIPFNLKITQSQCFFQQNGENEGLMDKMGWNIILDAIRLILVKYEPVTSHGDLF